MIIPKASPYQHILHRLKKRKHSLETIHHPTLSSNKIINLLIKKLDFPENNVNDSRNLITPISERESNPATISERLVPKINLKTVNEPSKSRNTKLQSIHSRDNPKTLRYL